ncbi:MAG TPA: hypothetical protein VFK06_07590 [Candidatus Angelobacter sp.]|nr:hypothetical protein [Candidatus Angelobacter sp.]
MSASVVFATPFKPKLKQQRPSQWSEIKLLEDASPWVTGCVFKISEFARLPQDWDSHGSKAVTVDAFKMALIFLSQSPLELVPEPSVSPVPGGGLGFHWQTEGRDLEIEILPDGQVEYLKTVSVKGDVKSEEGLLETFSDKRLWYWLAGELA